jgi:hypothetical protein
MSGAGENWAGYTKSENVPGEDGKAVSSEFARCWPPGTPGIGAATRRAPGAQQQPSRSLIHDAPKKPGGKRPRVRKAK